MLRRALGSTLAVLLGAAALASGALVAPAARAAHTTQRRSRSAPHPKAIDMDDYDGAEDEYEEAYARYAALGLFSRDAAEAEDEDDDATPEEMVALSKRLQNRTVTADEAARKAAWERDFVDALRAERQPRDASGGAGGST